MTLKRQSRERELLFSHRYGQAISAYRERLMNAPSDKAARDGLANALLAEQRYTEALPLFVEAHQEMLAGPLHGSPGRRIDLAITNWCLGNKQVAKELMVELIDGIINSTILYGDVAGGTKQGLLLHYMAVRTSDNDSLAISTEYLKFLVEKFDKNLWTTPFPSHVVRFLLDEISFEDMLRAAIEPSPGISVNLPPKQAIKNRQFLQLRFEIVALFHDGVKRLSHGDENYFLNRMRECLKKDNPIIEPEWYLARYEAI